MKKHPHSTEGIWISGINPVREALRSEAMTAYEMVFNRQDPRVRELEEYCRQRSIPVRHESRDVLSSIVGHAHHQGVALHCREYAYTPLESILKLPAKEREPLVILDCVQDPQNLGALMRSSCFLGGKGVIIPRDRSAAVTPAVIKVAAGAASYLPVTQVTNLARALEQLKDAGLWIVGLDVEGGVSIYEADLSVPLGLVVGNEQKGLRPLIRKQCDLLVRIPARGPLQSLNAAAAGTIALAEVERQRTAR